ncbi:MAG: hypothetical protein AUJ97_00825 [Bacteroidetes bacterium CG2_30_32_10]|nr:MAG: hypothetical protein AUJ97_00825 [Bacteroidetes bacterium CG2_30_32_10]
MLKKWFSFFFFILFASLNISVFAQDSIAFYESKLPKVKGIERAAALNKLIFFYQNNSLKKSIKYANQALLAIDSISNKTLKAEILYHTATTFRLIGDTKNSLKYYKAAFYFYTEVDNPIKKADIINNIGVINRYMGFYDVSLSYHLNALSIFSNANNKVGIISAINNIGIIYRNLGQNDIARKCYIYALNQNQLPKSKFEQSITLTNIGNLDWYEGNYIIALDNYWKALDISIEINDNNKICGLLNNIGNVLRDSGNLSGAIINYNKALTTNEKIGDNNLKAVILKNIGTTYYKKNKIDSALFFYNQSLELVLQGNLTRYEKDIYLNISNCYSASKNYEKSLTYFKLYTVYKDSLLNEKTFKEIAGINQQFQIQQKENQIFKIDIQKKQLTIYLFLLIIAIGLLLIFIIYRQYRQKKKYNHQLLSEIEERKKAEHTIQLQNKEIQSQYEELVCTNEELQNINATIEENSLNLSENEERYRQLFENSSDGLLIMTETISDCNIQACNLFDLKKEEIIGKSSADLSPAKQPNGRNSEVMATEYINKALRGSIQHFNWKHKRRDALLIDCEITLIPVTLHNTQVVFTKIVDITDRIKSELKLKESEEKYSSLINQVPIGIYRTNNQGILLFGNPALVRMLGYDSFEELFNINIKTLFFDKEDRNKQIENWKRNSSIISSDEVMLKRKDGSTIWVRDTSNAVIDKYGEIDYFSGIFEDITEQKTTQNKLERLIVNIPGVVYHCLMNGGLSMQFMSEETKNLTGFEVKEFVENKMLFSDIIHPADRDNVWETILNSTKTNKRYVLNYRIITKNGQIKWVYEQGFAVSEGNNNIFELEGIIIDINERKQAEEILKDSEEKYRSLVENISEVLFTLTTTGYFTYFSPKIEQITGYNVKEVIGKHFTEFIFKEDIPILKNSYHKTISGEYQPAEFRIIDKTGSIKHVSTSSNVILKDGIVHGISGIMTDITEKKFAEKVQNLLFNISQAANYTDTLDEFYITLFANLKEVIKTENFYIAMYNKTNDTISFPFFEDTKDKKPETRKFGNGLTEFVINSKLPLLKNEKGIKKMFEKGECELVASMAKSWLGVPLKSQDEVIGVMAIQSYTDELKFGEIEKDILTYCAEQVALVLEQKHNEELKHNIELAEKTTQIKQQFLANMSHEMRTPMNGILGMVDFLLKTKLDEKQLDFAKTIKNSSETLLNLINDILDLSKIEAGSMKIIPNDFNIHKLLKEVISLFKASIDQKGLSVKLFYSNDVPDYIIADKNRINQIINNLVSNAIKFTDSGEISISVSKVNQLDEKETIEPQEAKKIKIKIEVKDTGIGISHENRDDLFLSFSQIDSTYTRNYEGTGLGLAISKKLVEMLGGEIDVFSNPGKGSNFWFTFEAKPATESSVNKICKPKADYTNLNFDITVLLVEDKFINQKVVCMMLQNAGCKTEIANNGVEALEMFEKVNYDIVLMDIQMPVMDGVTAVKELHRKYPKLPPIIGLSANAMEGDAEKYIAEGMDDYLSKPVSAEQLYDKIIKWLAKKK